MYSFSEIRGNEKLIQMLKNSVKQERVAHAYIFDGAEGCGKSLMANCFAKYLFCETKEDGCTCHSCIQFDSGNHSDTVYIGLLEKAKSVSIEQVRTEVVKGLNRKPFEYDKRVYIIDRAELMTAEAQNTLLRSIEEPPPYAVFLLLSRNADKLLQTIRSRCMIYRMLPLGAELVLKELALLGVSEDRAGLAAGCSGGSIGKAIEISEDEGFFQLRKQINKVFAALRDSHDLMDTIEGLSPLEEYKENREDFLHLALLWFRDVLVVKSTGKVDLITQRDYLFQIKDSAEKMSYKEIYEKIRSVQNFYRALMANMPFSMALDALAVQLDMVGCVQNKERTLG